MHATLLKMQISRKILGAIIGLVIVVSHYYISANNDSTNAVSGSLLVPYMKMYKGIVVSSLHNLKIDYVTTIEPYLAELVSWTGQFCSNVKIHPVSHSVWLRILSAYEYFINEILSPFYENTLLFIRRNKLCCKIHAKLGPRLQHLRIILFYICLLYTSRCV